MWEKQKNKWKIIQYILAKLILRMEKSMQYLQYPNILLINFLNVKKNLVIFLSWYNMCSKSAICVLEMLFLIAGKGTATSFSDGFHKQNILLPVCLQVLQNDLWLRRRSARLGEDL